MFDFLPLLQHLLFPSGTRCPLAGGLYFSRSRVRVVSFGLEGKSPPRPSQDLGRGGWPLLEAFCFF